MKGIDLKGTSTVLSRRNLLRGIAAAGVAAPFISLGGRSGIAQAAKPIKLSWNANAACLAPVAAAQQYGIFAKHGLNVELVNFSGSTDQLLEAIASGKSDAGVGMALRWLKPLEQGFDVKITAGVHGGCLRLLTSKGSPITAVEHLKGKVVGVTDMASPGKNFFSVLLGKKGIDPVKDVEWRQYPGNLLALALEKGEVHAITDSDPLTYKFIKENGLVEISTNLHGEYADRTCCLVGVRGSLLRDDKDAATALTKALIEAHTLGHSEPAKVAQAFAQYTPAASPADVEAMLRSHTHGSIVIGDHLRKQLALYTDELKGVSVIKPGTDPAKFAEKITVDVV